MNYKQTFGNSAVELRINFHSSVSSWFGSFGSFKVLTFFGKNSLVYFNSAAILISGYYLKSGILGSDSKTVVMRGWILFTGMYSTSGLPPV